MGIGSPGAPFQHTFPVFQLEALGSTGSWTSSQPLVRSTDPRSGTWEVAGFGYGDAWGSAGAGLLLVWALGSTGCLLRVWSSSVRLEGVCALSCQMLGTRECCQPILTSSCALLKAGVCSSIWVENQLQGPCAQLASRCDIVFGVSRCQGCTRTGHLCLPWC